MRSLCCVDLRSLLVSLSVHSIPKLTTVVLINAQGGVFTNAAVFSGVTFLVGTALTCAPRTIRLIRELTERKETEDASEKA